MKGDDQKGGITVTYLSADLLFCLRGVHCTGSGVIFPAHVREMQVKVIRGRLAEVKVPS